MSMTNGEKYTDEYHNVHFVDKLLGQGGQGMVYRTKDADIALKIVTENLVPVTDEQRCREFREKLSMVRLLPKPEKIHLASPVAMLVNGAGYVMRLLNQMHPFEDFYREKEIKKEDIPEWLFEADENLAKSLMHYRDTGGLRRRLMGLGRGASVLARLHSHGLVYGDISHNNLFMSGDFNSTEVWLIDADNLRFAQADSRDIIYTWEYGAPEIMQGKRGINFRTDTHAFAVLAFKILMMQHPFKGSYVEEAPEDEVDWAGETPEEDQREARALRGEIPWIFDEEDSLNHSNNIFESLFPNPELKRLFNRTFGPGRTKFHLRPAIMHWPEALVRAADSTVLCRKCGMTYYIDLNNRGQLCPFCDVPRTSVLNALAYNFNYKGKREAVPAWSYSREYAQDVPAALPERLFVPFPMDNCDRKGVEITVESNKITIRQLSENLNLSIAFKSLEGGNFRPLPHNMRIPKEMLTDGFSLMSSGEQPRLINITFLEGVK